MICCLVSSTFEIPFFNGFAFVVFFLTFAGCDNKFNIAATGEKFDRDELEAVLASAGEVEELAFGDEEFNVTLSIGTES